MGEGGNREYADEREERHLSEEHGFTYRPGRRHAPAPQEWAAGVGAQAYNTGLTFAAAAAMPAISAA